MKNNTEKQSRDYNQKQYTHSNIFGLRYYNAQQLAGYFEQQGFIVSVQTARRFIRAIQPYRIGHTLAVSERQIKEYFRQTESNVQQAGMGDTESPLYGWEKGQEYEKRQCDLGGMWEDSEIPKSTAWKKQRIM